jgi:pRiA4b ORF-3-like protein
MGKDCGGRRVGLFGPLCSNQPPVETYDRPAISPGHHHAFDRWDEHMYEFQFGKGPMDPKGSRYVLPSAFEMDMGEANPPAGRVDQTRIDSLGLKVGQSFGYWFDFGDDWWHQINVEAIEDKAPSGKFPKVTKRVGKSPPQYLEEHE